MIIHNKINITWQQIEADSRELVKIINENHKTYKGIVAVARGGLGVATLLSRLLDIKLIDVLCMASYDKTSNMQTTTQIFKTPDTAILDKGKDWLVVDDLIDSGDTYKYIKTILPYGDFCCLYNKLDKSSEIHQKADVNSILGVKDYPKDRWIVLPWEIV